jgi:class 3 adenylate cyclase
MSTDKLDPSVLEDYLHELPGRAEAEWDADATIVRELGPRPEHGLEGLSLEQGGQRYPLELTPFLIGRDPGCTLALNSRTISRHHLAIYPFGQHYWVRDLHSTNGVRLNQRPVSQAVIRAGDQLHVGEYSFRLFKSAQPIGDYERECVVLFLDLENSTLLSEREGSPFTQAIQQEFSRLEDRILILRGHPIKQLGDGLMCAFGLTPWSEGDSAPERALNFAVEAVAAFAALSRYPGLRLRVGLHVGEVSLSREDAALDVFGDTVNLASRLEYCNKTYGTQILLSERVWHELPRHRQSLREIDTLRVPGRCEPVTLYSWEPPDPTRVRRYAAYAEALSLYRAGQFTLLQQKLQTGLLSHDRAAQVLRQRLDTLSEQAVPGWDGVWQLSK